MTSVRPLSCREESSEGSWNTKTVTTSVAAAGGRRALRRMGRGGEKEPNSPQNQPPHHPLNQKYDNVKIINPTGLAKKAKLTQEEERRAVIFGVADDVLQGGGQRTVHHFIFEVKSVKNKKGSERGGLSPRRGGSGTLTVADAVGKSGILDGFFEEIQHGFEQGGALGDALDS